MNLVDADRAREDLARAVSSGHPETIARTAVSNIWPLYTVHSDVLTATIVELPNVVLDRYPLLRILHPMTPVLARSARPFKPFVATQDARTMSPEELDFHLFAQMVAFRFSGDVSAALGYARRLEDRLLHTPVEARDRMDGPLWFFHHQIGTTFLAAGDTGRALRDFGTARQLGKFARQPYAERMALGRAALAHAVRGSLGDAERALEQARSMPEVDTVHASAATLSEATAAALIAVDRMSDNVDEFLDATGPIDTIELNWSFALLARCRAFLMRQRPEDSLEAIRFAEDAHPVQHGSFAADAVAAMTIDSLVATGDAAHAWRIAKDRPAVGVLTQLATARLALYDGRFDAAAKELRMIAVCPALGPAQRAELVLLSGWLELGRSGEIDRDTARQIARVARRGDQRRSLTIMPRQLVEQVKGLLQGESALEFEAVTSGLMNLDFQERPSLTSGELRILNALPAQRSTAMMAATFHVSPNTVKSQLQSLYRKLGCSTREEAVRVATRLRLLTVAAQD